ncbi:MAG: ribonuclease P protein component [Hyphomicrobiales bacterium]
MKATFKKSERLCRKKIISDLFQQGTKDFCYPYKLIYNNIEDQTDSPVQILISAPKKFFKHAYQRNRIKRLTREAYRLNKSKLYTIISNRNLNCAISFVYIGREIHEFSFIERKMKEILNRLCKHYEEDNS